MNSFSPITQERIGSYVYMLIDPRDNKIFYVGEGQGNRVFDHEQEAIESPKESDKLKSTQYGWISCSLPRRGRGTACGG